MPTVPTPASVRPLTDLLQSFITLVVLSAFSFSGRAYAQEPYSLDALQGAWWTDCEAPAAAFLIRGNEYSGDFEGSFELELKGDVLVFSGGFADGHSVNVTREPLSFRIVELAERRLVMRPLSDNAGDDWTLHSCDETQ